MKMLDDSGPCYLTPNMFGHPDQDWIAFVRRKGWVLKLVASKTPCRPAVKSHRRLREYDTPIGM